MSRLDHPRVVNWLANFPESSRGNAALLVNALRLVSETDLRLELGDLVESVALSCAAGRQGTVAAFPVREVPRDEAAHEEGRSGRDRGIEALAGSESVVGNIALSVTRRPIPSLVLVPSLDLDALRQAKVRTILLVNDFAGSGRQIIKCWKALRRHPTIRSWASFRWIQFHVVTYAATERAARLLRRTFGEDRVHIAHGCPTFATAGWTKEQEADVERLCLRHAGSLRKRYALGWEKSRALIAFEHTAPNNLPAVLWRIDDNWLNLFERKAVPTDLLRLFTMTPAPPDELIAGSNGAQRLHKVIDLVARRVRNPHPIAEATGYSINEVSRLLRLSSELGLTGANTRLTDRGRAEWNRWRSTRIETDLPNRDDAYYPHSLRAER